MKRYRENRTKFDEHVDADRDMRRSKKKFRNSDENEAEFQSWMNRPSDVSDYLDDDEDFHTPPRHP